MKTRSRIRIVEGLMLFVCFAFFGCGPDGGGGTGGSDRTTGTNNLTASGLVVVSAKPRVGYPLEVTTFIEAEEVTQDVSVSYYALNKSDVDRELDEVRQFFLATVTFPTVEPSVTEYLAEFTVPADVDPPGDYVIQYVIDPAETVAETAEDDNSASGDVRLAPLADPNIFIEELTLDSTAILLYDDFNDVERDGQELEDVQNSDVGATLVVGLEGALQPVDVEVTVDLRITRGDLSAGQDTYDVPMYLWDSVAQKYVDAFGVNGPPEGLSIGTLLPQVDTETEEEADFNTTDHRSRTSVHLDVYFPGRLAFEMKAVLENLVQGLSQPTPPDLTQEAINALKGFFRGASRDQVSFSIVAKVRATTNGFDEDVLVDNEASEEVFLILPGQRYFPPDEPLEEGTRAGFENKNFGVSFEFATSASVDRRGAIAEVIGGVPVTIFENEFDFLKFGARAQVMPAIDPELIPEGENSGFGLNLDVVGITVYALQKDLGYTYPEDDEDDCPDDDNDADGVPNDVNGNDEIDDEDDACPDEPGFPSDKGCPDPDNVHPPTNCPGAKPFSVSKEVTYDQLFFVGWVPFTASASVAGEIGFELYANIQPISLASKAGPFATLEVTLTGAVGIPALKAGVGGSLTLIDERFHGNVTTGLAIVVQGDNRGGLAAVFEGYTRMSVTNTLAGPHGELFLFADYPGVKWCSALGRSFPCGATSIRAKLVLATWESFIKEDVLFDETICKAVTIDDGVAFGGCAP